MAAYTTLTIAGSIGSEDEFHALLDAMDEDGPALDWQGRALACGSDIRRYVEATISDGKPLVLTEENREGCRFESLQETCTRLGLSYLLEVDMSLENEDAGHTEIWTPDMDEPLVLAGASFGGGPYVDPEVLIPILKEGRTEEALRIVTIAANPAAALPMKLSATFDLPAALTP